MFPSFEIFGKTFGLYAICAVLGVLLIGFLLSRRVKKQGYDENDAILFILALALGVVVGGSILYAITNLHLLPKLFSAKSLKEAWQILESLFGGSVFYGGLIGGAIAGFVFVKINKLDRVFYMDSMAALIPLFHAIARVGCFLGGCCYGIESSFGFTAHGNPYSPAVNDVRRFPVQLLESLGNLLIFVILQWLFSQIWSKKNASAPAFVKKLKGRLLPVYMLLYPILRFSDEFLRGDEIRGFVFGGALSTSQFISILMFVGGVTWLLITAKKSTKNNSDAATTA